VGKKYNNEGGNDDYCDVLENKGRDPGYSGENSRTRVCGK